LGYVAKGGRYNILLTDGRTLSEDDGTLVKAGRNFVETKDGQRYWWRKPDYAAPAAAAVPVRPAAAAVQVPKSSPPAQPEEPQGSWITGEDGVSRLREKPSLAPATVTQPQLTRTKG